MPSQDFSSPPKTKESKVLPSLTDKILPAEPAARSPANTNSSELSIYQAQDIIYKFFLHHINNSAPQLVWQEFKNLFIELIAPVDPKLIQAIHTIISFDSQLEFNNLFKRCCYILLNNWVSHRQYQFALDLVTIISERSQSAPDADNSLKSLRLWLANFVSSADYEEIQAFVSKYDTQQQTHWTSRYEPYLLVSRYLDATSSHEEREAAKLQSQQLKDKYKFELAMYTSRSQSAVFRSKTYHNPTLLGDETLRLIKIILVNRGSLSYPSLAKIFLNQSQYVTYKQFKESLIKYLFYYAEHTDFMERIQRKLLENLETLYRDNDGEIVNSSLQFRTCNHIIKCLTVENTGEPSALFLIFFSHLNPLSLAILLLKLVLISPNSRTNLELYLARLIQYHQEHSAIDCQWLINFLEICQIALTIYGENVQYNLVNMSENNLDDRLIVDLNNCRVFSQQKKSRKEVDS
ncbi:MAG: hypothetical protein MUE44_18760 [Oscillatoriaceae cyanobacterium Prado104]|jgi:hypothetical protein|nr:hypothetical protein [Oscillatoriaceae cyanobacterium Prado104]